MPPCLQKQTPGCGRCLHQCHSAFLDTAKELTTIDCLLAANEDNACAACKGQVDLKTGNIEARRGDPGDHIKFVDPRLLLHGTQEVDDVPMLHFNALRLSGGS